MEDTWLTCHRQFVKELDEWDKQGGWDVLFYGDSIVEEWRCAACPQHARLLWQPVLATHSSPVPRQSSKASLLQQ